LRPPRAAASRSPHTPAANFNGVDSVDYTVTDGALTDIGTLTINVTAVNDAPTLNKAISDQKVLVSNLFEFNFPANSFRDVDTSDTLTYTVTMADNSPLPDWLNFDSLTRTFSGTPNSGDVGELNLKVTADDGNSSVSSTFSIQVLGVLDPTTPPGVDPDPVEPVPDLIESPGTSEFEPITGSANSDPSGIKIVGIPQSRNPPDTGLAGSGFTSLFDESSYLLTEGFDAIEYDYRYADQDDQQPVQPKVSQIDNSNIETPALQVSDDEYLNEQYELELLRLVDLMHQGMDGEFKQQAGDVEVQIFMGTTASLTVGIVSWVLRGGSLLASLMSTVGLLNRFDPLPILKKRDDEEDVEPDDDSEDTEIGESDKKVERMFSQNSKVSKEAGNPPIA
jgi:hypothetical protein